MKETLLVGLGGQGPTIAGEVLVQAAIFEGKYAQSRPCYGPERRSGMVAVFYRLDDVPIRKKSLFTEADCLILMHKYFLEEFASSGFISSTKELEVGPVLLRVDDSVLRGMAFFGGTGISDVSLKKGGILIANSSLSPEEIKLKVGIQASKIAILDANEISTEVYGRRAIPIINTIMMGAFAKASNWLSLHSIVEAVRLRWPEVAETNIKAVLKGYECTKVLEV
jgi:pyruvate ferredoxin oxidoreductase gamma subunit